MPDKPTSATYLITNTERELIISALRISANKFYKLHSEISADDIPELQGSESPIWKKHIEYSNLLSSLSNRNK